MEPTALSLPNSPSCLHVWLTPRFSCQALDGILPPDAPAPSLFTQAMLNRSINATATAGGFVRFPGDSFSEQVADYVETPQPSSGKKVPIGWPIGVSMGVLGILAAAGLLGFFWLHQRRKIRQQQVHRQDRFYVTLLKLSLPSSYVSKAISVSPHVWQNSITS